MKKPRVYSIDFKREVVLRMAEAETIVALAKELGIPRPLLYRWRDKFQSRNRVGLERRRGRPSSGCTPALLINIDTNVYRPTRPSLPHPLLFLVLRFQWRYQERNHEHN